MYNSTARQKRSSLAQWRSQEFDLGGGYILTSHCNFKTCVHVPHVNKTVTDFGVYIPIPPPGVATEGGVATPLVSLYKVFTQCSTIPRRHKATGRRIDIPGSYVQVIMHAYKVKWLLAVLQVRALYNSATREIDQTYTQTTRPPAAGVLFAVVCRLGIRTVHSGHIPSRTIPPRGPPPPFSPFLHGVRHFPLHHHHPPVYNIKRSTVNIKPRGYVFLKDTYTYTL